MSTISFSLVSPEKILLERDVSMVVIPGIDGDIGVLPNHAPLLTLLRPGLVSVYEGAKVLFRIFVNGGFAEITPDKCTALVTEGTPIESIDKDTLELEIKNLLEDITDSQTPEEKKAADQNLDIARSKLMEIISYTKS